MSMGIQALAICVSIRRHVDVFASECLPAYLDIQSHGLCGGRHLCAASGGAACEKEAETGPRAAQIAQPGIEEGLSERE
jgi:hypothetical protein